MVVFSYAWVPLADPALVERVRASLKPHGLVVIEHPAQDPAAPRDPADEVNALLKAWSAWFRVLHYEDTGEEWDWRVQRAWVMRLLVEKW